MFKSIKCNLIMISFVIILFQEYLQTIIPAIKYFDEALALFLIVYYLYKSIFLNRKINKHSLKIMICIFAITCVGIISNFTSDIDRSMIAILYDIFFVFKIYIFYLGGIELFGSISNKKKEAMLKKIARLVRLIVTISFLAMTLNLILPNGFSRIQGEIRYGIRSFSSIFSGPAFLNMYIYDYIFILTADLAFKNISVRKKYIYIGMCLILWLSTLRSRAFSYVFMYIGLFFVFIFKRDFFKRIHLKLRYIILGGIAGIIISYNMILKVFYSLKIVIA